MAPDARLLQELSSLMVSKLQEISWLERPLDLSHYNLQSLSDPALVDRCITSGQTVFESAVLWTIRRHIVEISGFESDLIVKAVVQENIFATLARCTATVPLPTLSATQTLKLQFHLLVNGQEGDVNAAANWVSENIVDALRPLVRHCQKLEIERKAPNVPRPNADNFSSGVH
ncbi:hypothetical protein DFH06DRAFT_1126701 [Mycena polygramma]|nr:hypothetical protein DFH06DRAFT_1126701 [Mycena polygramma]